MTKPTFHTFTTLLTGWLLATQRTIIGMVRASGKDRHHAAFHRLFASAKWSIDRVGLAVFALITTGMKIVHLVGDDTLIPRTGLKVFGTGVHRDPMLSSRSFHVVRWGHCWIVLCVIIKSRWTPGRVFALPVLVRLYFNKKSAMKWNRVYRKKTDLMLDMLMQLSRHSTKTEKRLHFVADSSFTVPALLQRMPASIAVTGRVVMNVRVHEPPQRKAGQIGQPRRRGDRDDLANVFVALVGQPHNRKTAAVGRTAATGFLLYSLIICWHERVRDQPASMIHNWSGKDRRSFADMLASLRNETLYTMQQNHLSTPAPPPGMTKYIQHLTRLLTLAA